MPLTVVTYKCSKCFRAFDDREKARNCEKSHPRLLSAKAARYTAAPHPYSIEARFSDGKNLIYNAEDLGG
jgi:DNA-directed RNA polymerase subunit RPC12/RpoP